MIVVYILGGLIVYVAVVFAMCLFMGGLSRLERRLEQQSADDVRGQFAAIIANAYDPANDDK